MSEQAVELRVLTVRQPWAWAIVHGGKDVENRVRNIAGDYRGPISIHAGLMGANFDSQHPQLWPFDSRHVTGAIIGVVDLSGVHQGTVTAGERSQRVLSCFQPGKPFGLCSTWAQDDCWHLEFSNPRPLAVPIPFKGALGLRRLTDDVAAQVWAGVTS